ncbi:MAG TPA: hypothetical protein VFQ88_11045 [Nevskiaceae bacterium]|nr:hypothetical protein [Nevskiaceae bacterium]
MDDVYAYDYGTKSPSQADMKILSVRVPDFVYARLKRAASAFTGDGATLTDIARQAITDGIDSKGSQTENPVQFLARVHASLLGDGPALEQEECERFLYMVHCAFMLAERPRHASASCVQSMGRAAIAMLKTAGSAGYVMDDDQMRYLCGNVGTERGDSGTFQERVERHLANLPWMFPASREEMFSRVPFGLANSIRGAAAAEAMTQCLRAEAKHLYPAAVLGARREWRGHKEVDFGGLPGAHAMAEKFSAGDERNGEVSAAVSMFGDGSGNERMDAHLTFTGASGTLLTSPYPFGVLALLDRFMEYERLLEVASPGIADGGWVYGAGWKLEFNASLEKEPTLWSGGIITTITWRDIEQARDRLRCVLGDSAFLAKYAEWRMVMGGLA